MRVLLISDDPEKKTFDEIVGLEKQIESLGVKMIDVICFCKNTMNFLKCEIGQENLTQRTSPVILETILKKKKYELIVTSLKLENLEKLVSDERSIFDLFVNICSQATVFVFGGKSVLKKLKNLEGLESIHTYERHGVAKVSREFRDAIITYTKATIAKERAALSLLHQKYMNS